MDEVETIVSSGTKLNLNYYINQEVDMDVIEELMDYFRYDAASDSVEDALNELGNDYSDKEIRLVRLKFLCEVASTCLPRRASSSASAVVSQVQPFHS